MSVDIKQIYKSAANRKLLIVILLLLLAVFYIGTIREGHGWGDDFAMYIKHAQNLVEGRKYADTGYIYNPLNPTIGPSTYPPGFPLMLAPIYYVWGINLTAMKIEIVVLFWLSIVLLAYISYRHISFFYLTILLCLIGFNPVLWEFRNNIVSDIPFAFCIYLFFFLFLRSEKAGERYAANENWEIAHGIGLGILIALVASIRVLGILLIPTVLVHKYIRKRTIGKQALIITGTSVALYVAQIIINPGVSSYLDQLKNYPGIILSNIKSNAWSLSMMFDNGYSKILRHLAFAGTGLLFVIGLSERISKHLSVLEIFFIMYLGAIFLSPVSSIRYLIPIIPLYFYYIIIGLQSVGVALRNKKAGFAVALIIFGLFAAYAGKYTKVEFGPIRNGVTEPGATALFRYVKENTKKSDVFVFRHPRALALFANRAASGYSIGNARENYDYFKRIGADYVIVEREGKFKPIEDMIRMFSDEFELEYSNEDFEVYQFKKSKSKRDM